MNSGLIQQAKNIIEKIIYITLATVDNAGNPWSTPVFAAFDDQYNFYWRSAKDAIHSKNIITNGKVFITICDTTSPWGEGKGVFIQATAIELINETESNHALFLLDKRSPKTLGKADTFLHEHPRRVYKAIPEKIWINVDSEIDGYFVDKRVEIKLFKN